MLSPRKINQNSPTKQNISPSKKVHDKKDDKLFQPQILMSVIHELQCIVVKLGGKIPPHLNYGFNVKSDTIIRPQPVENNQLQTQIKNLKIKLSNYEFELKKLQQDEAQYKLISKMDRDKETKRLKAQIAKLQLHIREDNHKWEIKFQQMRQIYEKKANSSISKIKQSCQNQIKNIQQASSKQISNLIEKYAKIIEELQKSKSIEINQIKIQTQVKIQAKQKTHEEQKEKIRIKHVQSIQKLQKKQQQMITAFDSQKKIEQQKKDDEKLLYNKAKQKLYNDLYIVRKQKQQLNKTILELKTQIAQYKKIIQTKDLEIKKIQEDHKLQMNKLSKVNTYQIQKIKYNHKLSLQDIYKQHDKRLVQCQKMIQNIEETKQSRQQLLKQSQEDIQRKFQERPSRTQDTCKIQKLNYEIMAKQSQLNTARTQLKKTKLERDNNQKNYTRIFSAHGPRQKLSQRKNTDSKQKDRDKIYRQANTIDMSFLLKVCNKNF